MADNRIIKGLDAVKAAILSLLPTLRGKPLLNATRAGGRVIEQEAKRLAPVLDRTIYRNGHAIRKPGTMRDAIKVRKSKDAERAGDVGVFVNVKPLKKGAIANFKSVTGRSGAENPDDPFYWRWVHFRTKRNNHPRPFLTDAGQLLQGPAFDALEKSLEQSIKRLDKK